MKENEKTFLGLSARDGGIALSLANLFYLRIWAELFCAGIPGQAYFLKVGSGDFLAAVLNVLLIAAAFLAATAAARRFGGRHGRTIVIAGFVALIAVYASGVGPELEPGVLALREWWKRGQRIQPIAPVIGLLVVIAACWRWPQRSLALVTGIVFAFLPFVLVTFGRAAWIVATVQPGRTLAATAPPIDAVVPAVEGPRVVVLVFDGMSRRLAFEAKPDGIQLPAFDRLRAESIDATQVTQAGPRTKISLPAFLSGLPVTDSVPAEENDLLVSIGTGEDARKERWSEMPNLLRDAKTLGGVAVMSGWYHPYCRIFPDLDACSWYPTRTIGSHGQDTSFVRTMTDQQGALLPYVNLRIRQVDIFQRQLADARIAVVQGGKGIVFLHLMVPHKPWIWDGKKDALSVTRFGIDDAGYFDNVELADRVLGQLRAEMEAAGKWKDTAVVLTADHILSRPKRLKDPKDHRVPFIVKLPGQEKGAVYDRPFNAIVAHDLARALLRGEIADSSAAEAWLDARSGQGVAAVPAEPAGTPQ